MKMFFLLFLVIFTSYANEGYVDFGVAGTQFDIVEENGDDFVQKRLKEIDKNEIEHQAKMQIKEAINPKSIVIQSDLNSTTKKLDMVKAKSNIYDPNGKLAYKKGDDIPSILPRGVSLNICFINAGDEQKVVRWVIKQFGTQCIYMITNGNINTFQEQYKIPSVFPLSEQNLIYMKRFDIKMLPTKITKEKNMIIKRTLNIVNYKENMNNEVK